MAAYQTLFLRILQTSLALLVGLVVGLGAQTLIERQAQRTAHATALGDDMRSTFYPAAFATLDASVLVAGDVQPAAFGRIALPDGARFALGLASNRSGSVEVRTVGPHGWQRSQPLWSSGLTAGVPVQTPRLRLTGARGVETLEVVLRSSNGEEIARRSVEILHV